MNLNVVELNAYLNLSTLVIYVLIIVFLVAKRGIPPVLKSSKSRKIERMEYDLEDKNRDIDIQRERIETLKIKLNMMDKNRSLSLKEVNDLFDINEFED